MQRRDFLKTAGSFIVSAAAGLGCGDDDGNAVNGAGDAGPDGGHTGPDAGRDAGPDPGRVSFAQGVASGDPRPSSVMLWTRAIGEASAIATVSLRLQVATDTALKDVVVDQMLEAGPDSDHTVRVLVEDLDPDTLYYYRFTAGDVHSTTGRTWTAPEAGTDIPVRFAWVSCQDYSAGFYGAYRRMLRDDEDASGDDRLRFVLHVGDFIYETRNEGFQMALDDDLEPVMLMDADGNARAVPAFPSGGGTTPGNGQFAKTLDDYRHLYKTFLSDPDLQAARARWPFVCMWDDHEMSDDCWQTQANYTDDDSTDEPSQTRKVAANQAWFEFIPAILTESEAADGIAPQTHDFEPVVVKDVVYKDTVEVKEPNNQKALASITVYRRLRFGKHVDLILSDNRSYRSDHAVPEEATVGNPLVFHPRAALPLEVVNTFDAGRTANDGSPPDSIGGYANTRKDSAPGTILGPDQKQWWKDALSASSATFKVWANSIPLLRLRLDSTDVSLFSSDLLLGADAWDGYASERRELMTHLRDEVITNVISLSGDHHAHLVGVVHDDYDSATPVPVMTDFAVAGISSTSQFAAVADGIKNAVTPDLAAVVEPVLKLVVYDATSFGGDKAVVNLNAMLLYGSGSAMAAAATNDLTAVQDAKRPVNEHLRFVDTAANGYGLARFDAEQAQIRLVTIERPLEDAGEQGSDIRCTADFVVPRIAGSEDVTLDLPELTGKKPFPLG